MAARESRRYTFGPFMHVAQGAPEASFEFRFAFHVAPRDPIFLLYVFLYSRR